MKVNDNGTQQTAYIGVSHRVIDSKDNDEILIIYSDFRYEIVSKIITMFKANHH
jgi:O-methyltransferase involved in polyketide biosynthesis